MNSPFILMTVVHRFGYFNSGVQATTETKRKEQGQSGMFLLLKARQLQ